jgi:UDPglucose 6-dehydrogenase
MNASPRYALGVFGAGHVGLVTAACFAELGRTVVLYDVDATKIATLREGRLPIHEPGLAELVERGERAGRLRFTTEPREAVAGACAVFIAVGTPSEPDGRADLSSVREAAVTIARHLDGPTVVVNKSTVPVETGDVVASVIRATRTGGAEAVVASNPEFLREGSAVSDFLHPDRIVIGCDDPRAERVLRELYAPLDTTVIVTDIRTAEMIKYAANAFLATKISLANELAAICERVGADARTVFAGAGADKRIGTAFFGAGLGFGGSCLPKDVTTLHRLADDLQLEPVLFQAVLEVNRRQVQRLAAKTSELLGGLSGRRIGVLGLAFKPQTDDVRDSRSLALVEALLASGARVAVHDPAALANAAAQLGDRVSYAPASDPYAAATDADALIVATEWNEYRELDAARLGTSMRRRILIDARNLYDGARFTRAGFQYSGVGRATAPSRLHVHDETA